MCYLFCKLVCVRAIGQDDMSVLTCARSHDIYANDMIYLGKKPRKIHRNSKSILYTRTAGELVRRSLSGERSYQFKTVSLTWNRPISTNPLLVSLNLYFRSITLPCKPPLPYIVEIAQEVSQYTGNPKRPSASHGKGRRVYSHSSELCGILSSFTSSATLTLLNVLAWQAIKRV